MLGIGLEHAEDSKRLQRGYGRATGAPLEDGGWNISVSGLPGSGPVLTKCREAATLVLLAGAEGQDAPGALAPGSVCLRGPHGTVAHVGYLQQTCCVAVVVKAPNTAVPGVASELYGRLECPGWLRQFDRRARATACHVSMATALAAADSSAGTGLVGTMLGVAEGRPIRRILLTGWHQGGALAQLLASLAASRAVSAQVRCITFDSPRVATQELASLFGRLVGCCYSLSSGADPLLGSFLGKDRISTLLAPRRGFGYVRHGRDPSYAFFPLDFVIFLESHSPAWRAPEGHTPSCWEPAPMSKFHASIEAQEGSVSDVMEWLRALADPSPDSQRLADDLAGKLSRNASSAGLNLMTSPPVSSAASSAAAVADLAGRLSRHASHVGLSLMASLTPSSPAEGDAPAGDAPAGNAPARHTPAPAAGAAPAAAEEDGRHEGGGGQGGAEGGVLAEPAATLLPSPSTPASTPSRHSTAAAAAAAAAAATSPPPSTPASTPSRLPPRLSDRGSSGSGSGGGGRSLVAGASPTTALDPQLRRQLERQVEGISRRLMQLHDLDSGFGSSGSPWRGRHSGSDDGGDDRGGGGGRGGKTDVVDSGGHRGGGRGDAGAAAAAACGMRSHPVEEEEEGSGSGSESAVDSAPSSARRGGYGNDNGGGNGSPAASTSAGQGVAGAAAADGDDGDGDGGHDVRSEAGGPGGDQPAGEAGGSGGPAVVTRVPPPPLEQPPPERAFYDESGEDQLLGPPPPGSASLGSSDSSSSSSAPGAASASAGGASGTWQRHQDQSPVAEGSGVAAAPGPAEALRLARVLAAGRVVPALVAAAATYYESEGFRRYTGLGDAVWCNCQYYNTNAFVAWLPHSSTLLVAFRGTATFKDVLQDIKNSTTGHPFIYPLVPGVMVHTGFLQQLQGVIESEDSGNNIFCAAAELSGGRDKVQRVMLCGHSLGGGVAMLAAPLMACAYPGADVQCYTFGCSRVGNHAFGLIFRLLVGTSLRMVSGGDPVADMPPGLEPDYDLKSPYSHVPLAIHVHEHGAAVGGPPCPPPAARIHHHLLHHYFRFVGALCSPDPAPPPCEAGGRPSSTGLPDAPGGGSRAQQAQRRAQQAQQQQEQWQRLQRRLWWVDREVRPRELVPVADDAARYRRPPLRQPPAKPPPLLALAQGLSRAWGSYWEARSGSSRSAQRREEEAAAAGGRSRGAQQEGAAAGGGASGGGAGEGGTGAGGGGGRGKGAAGAAGAEGAGEGGTGAAGETDGAGVGPKGAAQDDSGGGGGGGGALWASAWSRWTSG